jgi:hypothetical protein
MSVLIKQDAELGGPEDSVVWQRCLEAMLALRVAGGALRCVCGMCPRLAARADAIPIWLSLHRRLRMMTPFVVGWFVHAEQPVTVAPMCNVERWHKEQNQACGPVPVTLWPRRFRPLLRLQMCDVAMDLVDSAVEACLPAS